MAYTPKTWTCGETITDVGLNNIEQGIQEALAGGGNLPEVTSADDDKVLTVVNGEWAKADRGYKCDGDNVETTECFEKARGYSCTESFTELFTETFTYEDAPSNTQLDYNGEISALKIKVTLNGTEYICDRTMSSGTARYGDSDLIAYPFALRSSPSLEGGDFKNRFKAPDNGDYTLKVEALGTSAETSDCFDLAVKSVIENNPLETRGYKCAEDRSDVSDCFTKAVKKILSITDATIVNSDGGLVAEPAYVVADLLNFALPVYIKEGNLQSMIVSSFQDGDGKWHFIVFDEHGTPREYITNNDGFPEWVH